MQSDNLAPHEDFGPIERLKAPQAPLKVLKHWDQGWGFADVMLVNNYQVVWEKSDV